MLNLSFVIRYGILQISRSRIQTFGHPGNPIDKAAQLEHERPCVYGRLSMRPPFVNRKQLYMPLTLDKFAGKSHVERSDTVTRKK